MYNLVDFNLKYVIIESQKSVSQKSMQYMRNHHNVSYTKSSFIKCVTWKAYTMVT